MRASPGQNVNRSTTSAIPAADRSGGYAPDGRFSHLVRKRGLDVIARRLWNLVFCATLLTSLVLTWASTRSIENFLRARIKREFPAILISTADRLDLWYAQRKLDVDTFAHSATVGGSLPLLASDPAALAGVMDYLSHVLDSFPQFGALLLTGPDGSRVAQVGDQRALPEAPMRQFGDVGQAELSDVTRVRGRRVQIASAEIMDHRGERLGALHALINMSALDELLSSDRLHVSGQLFLVDSRRNYPRLYNHRFFQEQLTREIARVERVGGDLTLMLIDIDNFKHLNDRYGHASGDAVLRSVARVMTGVVRDADVLARYGGEEFAVIPNRTDLAGAIGLAEKIRVAVTEEAVVVDYEGSPTRVTVTVSIGVSCFRGDRKAFFNDADNALYRAKEADKDSVIVES